jgi:ferredoxin
MPCRCYKNHFAEGKTIVMIRITIDSTPITVTEGTTILQAAAQAGIAIPSLCHYEGIEPPTSCFVCVVKIRGKKGLIPSCVAPAEDGMVVESSSGEVRGYRTRALELLLSEHAGDCEAPCSRICPCDMDIPAMACRIADGDLFGAIKIIKEKMPFPGILGYICPAPCQKGCRREKVDSCVTIRDLHLKAALADLARQSPWLPEIAPDSGKKVAVAGAGPAGLSAAWYLSSFGHQCTIVDSRDRPGGMLAFGVDRKALPMEVLDREIALLRRLGVIFTMNTRIGEAIPLEALEHDYDAIILAIGAVDDKTISKLGVTPGPKGIVAEKETFVTNRPKVFSCGAAVLPGKLAVRSMAQGRSAALIINKYLGNGGRLSASPIQFDSHLDKLLDGELEEFVKTCVTTTHTGNAGAFPPETITEASRCLRCDCSAKEVCDLRRYATDYNADQNRYRTGNRKTVAQCRYASGVVYEPGKCIVCGRCVGIAGSAAVRPGLTFVNRGSEVRVEAPFGAPLDTAMGDKTDACIAACPTGALSRIVSGNGKDNQ